MAVETAAPLPADDTVPATAGQRPLDLIRGSPALVPALLGVVLLLALAATEGGIEPTAWRPAALGFLGLLTVATIALPRPRPPRGAVVAVALIAAYALWSFASIAWADSQGVAVEGAGRALLYALVFALFALWPLRGAAPAIVAGTLGLGIAAIGLVELLRFAAAADPNAFMFRGRLSEPVGYANGNSALWMVGLIPCLVLAARREPPPLLRGVFLGSAGLLAGLALLGQSRGWLLAVPVVALLAVAIVPGRARLIVALAALGVGVAAMLDPVLGVYDASGPGASLVGPVDDAVRAIVFVAAALTFAGTIAAWLDRGVRLDQAGARRVSTVVVAVTAIVLALGAVVVATQGNPVDRVEDAWQEFKQGDTPSSTDRSGSRLTRDLATHRYDFWVVAWENFERAPVVGVGADNFQQDYLERGDSSEAPRYPHSLELSVLSETGIVGALLLLAAFAAALVVAAPGLRAARGVSAAGSAAGLLMFAYLAIHGSVDWLWEFPALGGMAFAMLGTSVAAAPWREGPDQPSAAVRTNPLLIGFAAVVGLLMAVVLALPWLSEREIERAIHSDDSVAAKLDRLDRAASLNPLSSRADLAAGSVAVAEGDLDVAARHFDAALDHDPRSAFAALMAGAIASEQGRRAEARELIARARRANPNSEVIAGATRRLRRNRVLSPSRIAAELAEATRRRTAPESDD